MPTHTPTIDDLIKEIQSYNPQANFDLIQKAFECAKKAHGDQLRESGEPYIIHPLATAKTLAQLKLNSKTIAAGLLHDVVDDTPITIENIEKEFGPEIAFMVSGVSKLGRIKYRGIEGQAEKLRRMLLAMAQDIRVVLIKLADRLHNLKTLKYVPEEKQKRIAMEALEIYAPLAYRLGMGEMKGQIEDAAFPYYYPNEYNWLMQNVRDKYQEREKYIQRIQKMVGGELEKTKVQVVDIHSRAKHYYSLYKKLRRHEMDLNKIYDLVALRIIVPTVEDCYTALGVIHKMWRPLPGRIKDYIAIPKTNGYQSIHTTVFCTDGKIVEIQIRTEKIHKEAEYGIAAHWHYAEKKGFKDYLKKTFRFGAQPAPSLQAPKKELIWIQQLQEWQKETKDPEEFLEGLKIDFFNDRIFVFTPMGLVIDLPEDATAVDFAYAIHTDVGHRCAEAKADGKIVALSQPLSNGQIVEILTRKEAMPKRDWLEFVKTSDARSKIKKWLREKERIIFEKETFEAPKEKQIQPPKKAKEKEALPARVEIDGQTQILIHVAKCCQPQPPDPINGYVTVSRGVTVHKIDCRNLAKIKNVQKLVGAKWKKR
ncbi:bifunctional (p)ppGpp synthetase/guanosine-3',5'-bis(diphosphate) 3'-pyrophosphohydrolase [Candidatus Falkowbacteria bacterium]|nr:bifunctional (p)ppGpp synthetase/guanosine-3',5'-bis(diphosphate) 3'-pyrophosphohydrolase [Candidatus Falkowbacteria bacterium]